jgi:hypothetical protein
MTFYADINLLKSGAHTQGIDLKYRNNQLALNCSKEELNFGMKINNLKQYKFKEAVTL